MYLLGIAGKKESGKDTLGSRIADSGLFDVSYCRWFATPMKQFLVDFFGVPRHLAFGGTEEKKQLTHIRWRDLPHFDRYLREAECGVERAIEIVRMAGEYMTVRKLLQEVGEELFDKVERPWPPLFERAYSKIHVCSGLTGIVMALDIRRVPEIDCIKRLGGKVVYLTRDVYSGTDRHKSETALDPENYDHSNFDAVLKNDGLTADETFDLFISHAKSWDWIQ